MQSLYLANNPQPVPPSGFMKFCSDAEFIWNVYILPPEMTPEQKIEREIGKLKASRDVFAKDADSIRSDLRYETRLLKQCERDRDHKGIERARERQVRLEKREKFLLRQVGIKEKCIEEITTIKGDHEQTLSLLIVMNATNKKSVSYAEAYRITKTFQEKRATDKEIKDMVEMALSEDEEDKEEFNEEDQKRVDELVQLSKDIGDQRMMENIPIVTGISHQSRPNMENMSQKELELQCRREEKKIEQFLMGIK